MNIWDFLLILFLVCIIPAILNSLFMFITVKFNLWTWISRMMFCEEHYDSSDRIDSDSIKGALIPFGSAIFLFAWIMFHLGTVIYYLVKYFLYPFEKLLVFLSNGMTKYFTKIEDKREFYNELNRKK